MDRTVMNYIKLISFIFILSFQGIAEEVYAKDTILIIRADGKDFRLASDGVVSELEDEFSIQELIITEKTGYDELNKNIEKIKPKTVVLMDNNAISLYKKYQSRLSDTDTIIPSVSIMSAFVENAIQGLKKASCILYEVPLVTSIVNLRAVLDMRCNKIGIVHREFMTEFINQNAAYCKREDIEIVSYVLPDKQKGFFSSMKSSLKQGLKSLLKRSDIDVIWVPNDNVLVNEEFLVDVWLPMIQEYRKTVIVGVEILVKKELDFGTFAVIPDHFELGVQAAGIIYDFFDNDWNITDNRIDPPRSVFKIINLNQVEHYFKIKEDKLSTMDKIIQ
ncbi:MAG: hypothetical protein HQK76_14140 [Desulfobacterales bacterium]|nr:hypothetical protein [Desulfobacterales bacterium]